MAPVARAVFDLAVLTIIWCGVFEPWKHRGIRLAFDCAAGIVVAAAAICGLFDSLDHFVAQLSGNGR